MTVFIVPFFSGMRYTIFMQKVILLLLFLFAAKINAQEPVQTIKIKREQNLVKVIFDNTEYRLFPIDRFGNPKDNEIVSYTLWIKANKTIKLQGFSSTLTPEMLKELKKVKKATKIFFTQIKVKGDDEHLIDMPDIIDTWFPDCKNCIEKKKK